MENPPRKILSEIEELAQHLTGFFPLGESIFSFENKTYKVLIEPNPNKPDETPIPKLELLYDPRKDDRCKNIERYYTVR